MGMLQIAKGEVVGNDEKPRIRMQVEATRQPKDKLDAK